MVATARRMVTTHRRSRSIPPVRFAAWFVSDRRVDSTRRSPSQAVRARQASHRCITRAPLTSSPPSRCAWNSEARSPESISTFAVTSTVRVTGTALNAAGQPLVGRVSLGVSQRSGSVASEPRVALIGAEGAFELADIAPGDYVLQAQGDPGPGVPRRVRIRGRQRWPTTIRLRSRSGRRPARRSRAAS